MKDYYFKGSSFVVENYLQKPTFSNFLPGVAGKKGIPLWAFYVNRGQGISGFGIQDKNGPIMEFTPANKAYESVGQIGFRTFLKVDQTYYEPFSPDALNPHRMYVNQDGFTIEEDINHLGLKLTIKYFGLPNENLAGLIRRVTLTNISGVSKEIEMVDGLAEILPAGIRNIEFKDISNLLQSWMDVDDLDQDYAFYKLRSSTADESEVVKVLNGNFVFAHHDGKRVRPIVDQENIFGHDNSKRKAYSLINSGVDTIKELEQVTVNKIPCAFIPIKKHLNQGESTHVDTVIGYTHGKEELVSFMEKASNELYLNQKEIEAKEVIEALLKDVSTSTSRHEFNEYIKQNYLDNLLRGGYPYEVGNTIYHLYSRRHGDLERDYNFFSLSPEYYSQGGGNFRDVCQNRRMDSMLNRNVKSFNVKHFASLIQLDGYNPLAVNGMTYTINDEDTRLLLIKKHFNSHKYELLSFLKNKFTPGGLINFVENNNIKVQTSEKEYLDDIIIHAKEEIESVFAEGYWSDHFTYILDLVESYEAIYPDKMKQLLFEENDIKTFDSPIYVLPKDEKSVINTENNIRQYGSILHEDHEKVKKLKMNPWGSNWAKIGDKTFYTNLYTKLLILALNKHSNFDPDLIGVEMESNKPGWNDAMNGVPGLFGSGVSESIELLRIAEFLLAHLQQENLDVPIDVYDLLKELSESHTYKDILHARETYRKNTRFGLKGEYKTLQSYKIRSYLEGLITHIKDKIDLLYKENDTIIPTFLVYDVKSYEEKLDARGNNIKGNYKMPLVNPLSYQRRKLPNFLEAPARLLKTTYDKNKLRTMAANIKQSGIYDKELKMYKTSDSLDMETNEIGRVRAFTKGWLERESNFLHMTYKYLLGLLRAELYEEFFLELEDNLVCFMDPAVYKRSTLENSSFIAPSNNPNKKIHGQGFYARLSGSTVETINIWMIMMTGGNPFKLSNDSLVFRLEPKLPASFFKEDKTVSFTFMKDTEIIIVNKDFVNTYESTRVTKYELINDEEKVVVESDYVNGTLASNIRKGLYKKIKVYIEK